MYLFIRLYYDNKLYIMLESNYIADNMCCNFVRFKRKSIKLVIN